MRLPGVSTVSWLYVRGIESIRVVLGDQWKLLVNGPGAKRWSYTFDSDDQRFEFKQSLEERLRVQGWVLDGYDRDRRRGTDRRAVQRATRDRRRAADERKH